ncbi:hypothetical protein LCGC14_1718880, partial [marine sediment metagenome]
IQDFEDKERVLNYFYDMCLDNKELNHFKVNIEGTDLVKRK